MSRISLSGNAAGTGTLTIASPNTLDSDGVTIVKGEKLPESPREGTTP